MSIKRKVKDFIVKNFLFGEEKELADDTSFLKQNIIDSTGVLELVDFLESQYGIQVEDDELVPGNLDSLQHIEKFIERKMSVAS